MCSSNFLHVVIGRSFYLSSLCLTAAFSVTMLLLRFTGNASCFGLAYTCLHFILTHCKSELLIHLTITDKTCLELGNCNRDGEGRGFYHVIICTDQFFLRWGGNHLSLIHVIKWQGGSIDYKIKSIRGQNKKKNKRDWCTSKNLFVFFSQLPDEKIL